MSLGLCIGTGDINFIILPCILCMYTVHMVFPLLSVQWSFYYLNSLNNGKLKPIDLYTEFHSNTLIEHTVYTLKQNTLIEQSLLFE